MNFEESTQLKNWILDKDELDKKRKENNIRATHKILNSIKESKQEKYRRCCLSADEELELNNIFSNGIIEFFKSLKRSYRNLKTSNDSKMNNGLHNNMPPFVNDFVMEHTIMYFKRCLLNYSIMEVNYYILMCSCIYLSTKVCDNVISIDSFIQVIKQVGNEVKEDHIRDYELLILNSMEFEVHLHSPLTYFQVLSENFSRSLDDPSVLPDFNDVKSEYYKILCMSDLLFLYPPSTIAMALLQYKLPSSCLHFIQNFVRSQFGLPVAFEQSDQMMAEEEQYVQQFLDELSTLTNHIQSFFDGELTPHMYPSKSLSESLSKRYNTVVNKLENILNKEEEAKMNQLKQEKKQKDEQKSKQEREEMENFQNRLKNGSLSKGPSMFEKFTEEELQSPLRSRRG